MLVQPDGGEHVQWMQEGHQFCLKIALEDSAGFSLTEAMIPPGKGAGLHIHEQAVECWYVLEGEYQFTVGESVFTAGRGAVVLVPRGTPHGLVAGDTGGKHLTIFAPAGCETAFREIGVAQQSASVSPEFWAALGERTHTKFKVGPERRSRSAT